MINELIVVNKSHFTIEVNTVKFIDSGKILIVCLGMPL